MHWRSSLDAPRTRVELTLTALSCAFVMVLVYQVIKRVAFPWDLYFWSESPFLTNMVKLSAGVPVFGDPADGNSFVYSPGLEYLTYGLLKPLGLALDIRACRIITVLLGVAGAVLAARSSAVVLEGLDDAGRPTRTFRVFATATMVLVVFRNFTSDVCHPDNLHIFHACLCLYLCLTAITSASYGRAVAAVALAGLAVLVKQTAALGVIGIVGVLFLQHQHWSRRQRIGLVAIGALVAATTTLVLLGQEHAWFYLVDVLRHHERQWSRLGELFPVMFAYPHHAVLLVAGLMGAFRLLASPSPRGVAFLLCWVATGIEVLPSLLAYVKAMGSWNNLGVVDVWLAILALPVLWELLRRSLDRKLMVSASAAAAVLAVLVLVLVPLRTPPRDRNYRFAQRLEDHVRTDVRAGRRVLLPHGMAVLIRAGATEVPLDRANSILELRMARLEQLGRQALESRIASRHYDRIYMFIADWYSAPQKAAIEQHYEEIGRLPGDGAVYSDAALAGYQPNFTTAPVRIMAPRPQ